MLIAIYNIYIFWLVNDKCINRLKSAIQKLLWKHSNKIILMSIIIIINKKSHGFACAFKIAQAEI